MVFGEDIRFLMAIPPSFSFALLGPIYACLPRFLTGDGLSSFYLSVRTFLDSLKVNSFGVSIT
jgi:hypothetical protein